MAALYSIEISANAVAWYGAVVATIGCSVSAYNAWRDRPRIEIKYQKDMAVHGVDSIYPRDKTYFNITVINKGRRPINISKAAIRTIGHDKKFAILADSFFPHRNSILTETNPVSEFMMEQDEKVLESIWYISVYDATGKEYRKYMRSRLWRFWYWIKNHK